MLRPLSDEIRNEWSFASIVPFVVLKICTSTKANLHSNIVNSESLVVKVEVFHLTTLPHGLPEESKERP